MKANGKEFMTAIRQAAAGYRGPSGLACKIAHEGQNSGHEIEQSVASYFESLAGTVFHLPRGFRVAERPVHADQLVDLARYGVFLVEVKTPSQLRRIPTLNLDQWLQLPIPVLLATASPQGVLLAPVLERPTNLRLFSRYQPTLTTSFASTASTMTLVELSAYYALWTGRDGAFPIDLALSPIVSALPYHPGRQPRISDIARIFDTELIDIPSEVDEAAQRVAQSLMDGLVPRELHDPSLRDHVRDVVRTLVREVSRRPKPLRFFPLALHVLSYETVGDDFELAVLTLEQTSSVATLLSGLPGKVVQPRLTTMLQAGDLQVVRLGNWLLRTLWNRDQVSNSAIEAVDRRLAESLHQAGSRPWVTHTATDLALTMLYLEPEHRTAREFLVSTSKEVPEESVRILLDYYGGKKATFERMNILKTRRDQIDGVREFEVALHRAANERIREK